MPIIRITKEQIEKANKARKVALVKDPEFRIYDERQQLQRQAALSQKEDIKDPQKTRQAGQPNDADCDPCHDRKHLEREADPRKSERRS